MTLIGQKLHAEGINFKETILDENVHTVSEVAQCVGCNKNQVLKAMLFIGEKISVLVITNGKKRIDKSLIESFSNQKLHLATPKEVKKITSYSVGSVSPFLINQDINILLMADQSILENEELYMGSGEQNTLLSMTSIEFKKAFKGKFISIN